MSYDYTEFFKGKVVETVNFLEEDFSEFFLIRFTDGSLIRFRGDYVYIESPLLVEHKKQVEAELRIEYEKKQRLQDAEDQKRGLI